MIELIGLPGCGKTTYLNKLSSKEDFINPLDIIYNDNHFIQNLSKLIPIAFFFFLYPIVSIKTICLLIRLNYTSIFRRVKMFSYVFSVLGAIVLCKKKYPCKNLIVDEGINQVLVYVMYESKDSEFLVKRLWVLLRPFMSDEILYLKIDKDIVLQRLMKRNGKHGSEVNRDVINNPKALDKAIYCQEIILDMIKSHGLKLNIKQL